MATQLSRAEQSEIMESVLRFILKPINDKEQSLSLRIYEYRWIIAIAHINHQYQFRIYDREYLVYENFTVIDTAPEQVHAHKYLVISKMHEILKSLT